ncbi:hypothetical protein Tco_0946059 [Tanacetum coccineum]
MFFDRILNNDQIIVPVSDSSLHCAVCGTQVDGPYCHGCTLIRLLVNMYGNANCSTDLIEAMQDFLKEQVVDKEQTQPEYLQELLQSLLKDLQILNEIQPLKQETPNQIQKDQEEKSITELLAEERLQKANQALNEKSISSLKLNDNLGFYAVHPNTIHTPVSQNVEPKDSLIMGDGIINTIPETETISVETLVSNPSESDDFSLGECNLFDIDDSYFEKSKVDGGEIDLEISRSVDFSSSGRKKLVESYLLIEKINAFSLSPPIPISPIICPSSTIPVVDLDLLFRGGGFPDFGRLMVQNLWKDKAMPTISIDDLQSSLHKVGNLLSLSLSNKILSFGMSL